MAHKSYRLSLRPPDRSARLSYRPLIGYDISLPTGASGATPDSQTKAELLRVVQTLNFQGLSALQGDMNGGFIRPVLSWFTLDTLIQRLDITDFALKHLQTIFAKPFEEDIRALEMQRCWESIPYTFEAEGSPAFLFDLSRTISIEAKCILAKKWSEYCAALFQSSWSRALSAAALKHKLDIFCREHLLTPAVDGDPWQWACAFEDLLRESGEEEVIIGTLSDRASDVVLDELHRHKQRVVAGLIVYRSSVQVQINKAQSIRVILLAIGASFAFAAWSVILNNFM